MKEYIEAGKIINTHGVSGEMKLEVWLDSPAYLKTFKRIFAGEQLKEYKVLSARTQKGFVLIKLEGIEDMNAAMAMKDTVISVARKDAALRKGSYFLCDIIGAAVRTEDGEMIGVLEEIMENPAHPIFIVRGSEEHLIPAVPEFVISVDLESNDGPVVTVRLIEGM